MLLLGIDLGTSSVKVSVVDAQSQRLMAKANFPEDEADIIALHTGWAEQDPNQWWAYVQEAILKCHATKLYDPKDIVSIGIAYQMHGLVVTDAKQTVLRNAIIWCDSRSVEIGNQAFEDIGEAHCLAHLLNSPGNFTASKLAWVKANEPAIYEQIEKVLLPGDFIAMKMTGECTTSISALSEGVFWDFQRNELSKDIGAYFGFDASLFPIVQPVFSIHGLLNNAVANTLQLKAGIPIAYKAGDQPNNALSLNVLEPGEVAATAGTSGVIYGVSDQLCYDKASRINTFAHVNHQQDAIRTGVLLCINGTGIFNRWIKQLTGNQHTYAELNAMAATIPEGSNGLMALPFGNGAERMLNNKIVGAHFSQVNLNLHSTAHMVRAVQEGIAFSMRYGLDIMRENGMYPSVVRAGKANLFLSEVFTAAFASVNQVAVEFYDSDGSYGAAIGAGIGSGIYQHAKEAFQQIKPVSIVEPAPINLYQNLYADWVGLLENQLYFSNHK